MRTEIAPWLRTAGFRGSGNNFALRRDDDWRVMTIFQRSRWNNRDSVRFDVNVIVLHPPTLEVFREANLEAKEMERELELPEPGNFSARLSQLRPERTPHFPWLVNPHKPTKPTSEDVILCIRDYFLPLAEAETHKALPSPTPTRQRRRIAVVHEEVRERLEQQREQVRRLFE
jgi:hypothetical protein